MRSFQGKGVQGNRGGLGKQPLSLALQSRNFAEKIKNAAQKFQNKKRLFPHGIKLYRKTANFFGAGAQEVPQNYCNFCFYAV